MFVSESHIVNSFICHGNGHRLVNVSYVLVPQGR